VLVTEDYILLSKAKATGVPSINVAMLDELIQTLTLDEP
jgi:hypothetical protein